MDIQRIPTASEIRPYFGMATAFNDANAWINGQGNLSLGNAGRDDASADPAALYAKGDVWISVPLPFLVNSALTQAATFARTSAGLYTLALAAAASTGIVVVPINFFFRKFASTTGGVNNPHGMKLLDFVLAYTVATAAETSVNVTFNTVVDANATARAATTTALGAVTYENPIGTSVANLPVATQATPYVCRAIPATPIFINTDNTELIAEIACVNPGTSVITFTHIGFHASLALY
jgi:hypothetical protein